jgi:hypothetical protein
MGRGREGMHRSYRVLLGKFVRIRRLRRPRRRLKDNINMDVRKIGFEVGR